MKENKTELENGIEESVFEYYLDKAENRGEFSRYFWNVYNNVNRKNFHEIEQI